MCNPIALNIKYEVIIYLHYQCRNIIKRYSSISERECFLKGLSVKGFVPKEVLLEAVEFLRGKDSCENFMF